LPLPLGEVAERSEVGEGGKRSVRKSAVAVTLSVDYGDSTKRTKSNPASAVVFLRGGIGSK